MPNDLITEIEKSAVYKTIYGRRDVRNLFTPEPIPSETLARILIAAHHAGSVGFMQPWNFIVVEDQDIRKKVKAAFLEERAKAAELFEPKKKERYLSFKLEGILEAPVNLLVTSDPTRFGPQVIGRRSMPETDVYSTCCAIQNLWLAARAENIGVGWVSIIEREALHQIFNIPTHITIVAYLCVGHVTHFPDQPDLERLAWGKRQPLEQFIFFETWEGKPSTNRRDVPPLLREKP